MNVNQTSRRNLNKHCQLWSYGSRRVDRRNIDASCTTVFRIRRARAWLSSIVWGITIDGKQWWKRLLVKIDIPVAAPPLLPEWISLDDAIRYIDQKSQRVAEQNNNDPMLPVHVEQTLQDALLCGDLRARGRMFHVLRGGIENPPLRSLEPIPADYSKAARLDAYWALQLKLWTLSTARRLEVG
jgi:hypothetical protein